MAVIRLDKIAGVHLSSVQHTDDLLNGNVVQLGNLVDGESELYEVKVPTTDADITDGEFLLHATPEVDPDPRKAGFKHFVVKAGEQGRAYHLSIGDIITLTEDLIDGTPAVGDFVVPQLNSVKLEASEDGTTADVAGTGTLVPRMQGKVIQETTLGYDADTAYVIRIVKA